MEIKRTVAHGYTYNEKVVFTSPALNIFKRHTCEIHYNDGKGVRDVYEYNGVSAGLETKQEFPSNAPPDMKEDTE